MSGKEHFNPEDLKEMLQGKYGPGVKVEVFPRHQPQSTDETEDPAASRERALEFDYKPSQIKAYLDRYVIQQDAAKKVLATAVCDHYHHIQDCKRQEDCRDYKKQNIIVIGPTGVGKTYLIQNIARLIGVPFVKADATKYSETGYVGGDVEDLIRELVHQADGDVELAQYGIVYLDEIDKIAGPINSFGRDVSGHGVQRGLLKLTEETEVPLRSASDVASQMQAFVEFQSKGKIEKKTINTKHILFIVSGAFTGLTEIIKRRIGSKQIGFMGEPTAAEQEHFLFSQIQSSDFIDYGFEAEFVGRFPVTIDCHPLSVDDLFAILKYSEGSLLKQYKKDFLAYSVDAYFTDGGMKAIAERATRELTGARGLMTVCEKLLRNYKYCLPDHPKVRELVVTRQLVENPQQQLEELIRNPDLFGPRVVQFQLRRFQEELERKFGVRVTFTDEAAQQVYRKARETGKEVAEYCSDLFGSYEHGFNLLRQAEGRKVLVIGPEDVDDPGATVERWVTETYR